MSCRMTASENVSFTNEFHQVHIYCSLIKTKMLPFTLLQMRKLELIYIFKEKSFGIMFAFYFCRNESSSLCVVVIEMDIHVQVEEQLMQKCFGECTFNSTLV